MKRKVFAALLAALLLVTLTACGEGEETTVTGMVTAVEGTVLTIVEMDGSRGGGEGEKGQMPSFEGFDGQLPEGFDGTMPNGEDFPQRGENGEMPELPEGETMPSMPENGERPSFEGDEGQMPDMDSFTEGMETTRIDIGDAHISVETDGVKASGSLSDIKAGVFVTITKNGKGEVTGVLVTSMSGFGGGFGGGFRGGNAGGNADGNADSNAGGDTADQQSA